MSGIAGIAASAPESLSKLRALLAAFPAGLAWQSHTSDQFAVAAVSTLHLPQEQLEDQYAAQPIHRGALTFVADVRIDNREELAGMYDWDTQRASRQPDSEFFSEAWMRWGQRALDRLVGGFAVAIWDAHEETLTLVRDHVGERPLFYLWAGERLVFASLPMPLRALGFTDTSLDEDAMLRFVALADRPPDATLFHNLRSLPQGHLLTFRRGELKVHRYWHALDAPQIRFRRDDEYIDAFRECFDRAVAARLRTIGNAGSELSGGMDSSAVTATAARLLGETPLIAFTSVPQRGYVDTNPAGRFGNEGPAATALAAMYPNIRHVLVDSSGEDMFAMFLPFSQLEGKPVFNPVNQMWINAMRRQARERGITVMLNGISGNTTLSAGGMTGLAELFRDGRWFKLARTIYRLRRGGHTGLRDAVYMSTAGTAPNWLLRMVSPEQSRFSFDYTAARMDRLVATGLNKQVRDVFFSSDGNVEAVRRTDFEYLDNGVTNGAASFVWQMELRDPARDKRILEFCYGIPIEQYLVGFQPRSLVRRAMRGRVPEVILACRDRGLQGADWFLTMGARRVAFAEELAQIRRSPMAARILDLDRMQRLLDTWPTTGFERPEISNAWHLALSRGIAVGHFIRHYE